MDNQANKIKKSLRYSILDGAFYSIMTGFGECFFPAFAVFLQASNFAIGILSSLPQTVGYFSQLFANQLIKIFKTRQHLVCIFALLQGLMHLPIVLTYFIKKEQFLFLLFFICLYWILGMLPVPAWNSWMGDLVDEKKRGAYFGRRNKIIGIVNFGAFLTAGFILQQFTKSFMGYILLFSISVVARIISFYWLIIKYEPPYDNSETEYNFFKLFKELKIKNFKLFALYQGLMYFSLFIAAPYFAPYMLKEINFNYFTFTVITGTALFAKYLAMPLWGRLSDRYGTKKILEIAGFLMPLNPLLWVFSANIYWLLLAQIYGGIAWAGFELASFVFIYDITPKQRRTSAVAVNNSLIGLAMFAGSLFGAYLIRHHQLFRSEYYLAFVVSFFIRYIASLVFIPRLEEAREVEKVSTKKIILELFTALTTKSLLFNLPRKSLKFEKPTR